MGPCIYFKLAVDENVCLFRGVSIKKPNNSPTKIKFMPRCNLTFFSQIKQPRAFIKFPHYMYDFTNENLY